MTDPSEQARALEVAFDIATEYIHALPGRHVGPRADPGQIMAALGSTLADDGLPPDVVIRQMATAVEPGLVASSGPRYFGFVSVHCAPRSTMSQSMTRIRRIGAAALLVAVSFSGGVANGASEPSESPETGRWPTGSELRASLGTHGYAFSLGAPGSPWTGDGFWTGGQADIPGSYAWPPERSVRLDGADDAPATARLLVGGDARLTQLLDVGTAMGASTGQLLDVSDLVRESTVPAQANSCVFAEWPLEGGRIVLWRGDTFEAADVEVAFEPLQDNQAVGTSPDPSSSLDDVIPASAEEACPPAGAGATVQPSTTPGPGPSETAPITVVTIEAREFGFSPAAVTIPASGATRIVVKDAGRIVHNFTIDALGVQVVVPPGGSGEVTLVDPAPGTYQFHCSISGHKEAGMVGTITVE